MPCLITGGAGFIGSHLAEHLQGIRPGSVRVLDNLTRARRSIVELRAAGIDAIEGDIRRLDDLRQAMRGCEVVYHLAAMATVMDCERDPAQTLAVNVEGTYAVLAMARELGVKRVVIASSREVYGDPSSVPVSEDAALRPKNAYGKSKAAAEAYASYFAGHVEITMLRLSNVYGAGDTHRVIPRFIELARTGEPLTIYGGEQVVDFLWVEDAVAAFVAAGTGPYVAGSINVGSGVGVTIKEAAVHVLAACGSASEITVLPTRAVEVSRFVADITRAKRELGLVSRASPLQELKRLVSEG